jgi:hypothetical protein
MNPERTLSKNVVCLATKILQIVAPHGHLKHLELKYGDIEVCEQEEWQEALTQICPKLTFLYLGSITALITTEPSHFEFQPTTTNFFFETSKTSVLT